MDASEFHHIKVNAEEMISDNTKNRIWTINIYWRRSGFENSNLHKVPSKFEVKFKKSFLENQTGFHQPTKQEVIAHQHSAHSHFPTLPKARRGVLSSARTGVVGFRRNHTAHLAQLFRRQWQVLSRWHGRTAPSLDTTHSIAGSSAIHGAQQDKRSLKHSM